MIGGYNGWYTTPEADMGLDQLQMRKARCGNGGCTFLQTMRSGKGYFSFSQSLPDQSLVVDIIVRIKMVGIDEIFKAETFSGR